MTQSFRNPPVVEFSIAVQFAPLVNLTNGHFGLYWQRVMGRGWTISSDDAPIEDQFEVFGEVPWGRQGRPGLRFAIGPTAMVGRLMLTNETRDRVLHVQPTRFMLSWRKTDKVKPSYKVLIQEFIEQFQEFQKFVLEHSLGEFQSNQWEITYVDSFEKGQHWRSSAEWSKVLPGLFGELFDTSELDIQLERRTAQWSYEISPQRARLHIAAQLGRLVGNSVDTLLLTMTTRGPLSSNLETELKQGLDLGHEKSVQAFMRLVHPSLPSTWDPIP